MLEFKWKAPLTASLGISNMEVNFWFSGVGMTAFISLPETKKDYLLANSIHASMCNKSEYHTVGHNVEHSQEYDSFEHCQTLKERKYMSMNTRTMGCLIFKENTLQLRWKM